MTIHPIKVSSTIYKEIDEGNLKTLTIPADRTITSLLKDNPPQQLSISKIGEKGKQITFAFTGHQAIRKAGKDFLCLPLTHRQYNLF
ncbi:MAG: hypothetical protein OCC45_10400 [Desulfotalea sp.]